MIIVVIFIIVIIFCVVVIQRNNIKPNLNYYKSKIFPYTINDIVLSKTEIIHSNFNSYTTNPNEIIFLIKLNKLMNDPMIYSMAEEKQINQVLDLVKNVINCNIEGDIVEIGVWKGGMSMWIAAILKIYSSNKTIYLFDTFSLFPKAFHFKDLMIEPVVHTLYENYPDQVSVLNNFIKFGLYNKKVKFIKGPVEKTFHFKPSKISVLRIDCDYYHSILFSLKHFYPSISKGGYIIIDDYKNNYVACKEAVDLFRSENQIENAITTYGSSISWQI